MKPQKKPGIRFDSAGGKKSAKSHASARQRVIRRNVKRAAKAAANPTKEAL